VCELLQVILGMILESSDQKTRGLCFKVLFHGDFLNTLTSCSMKCLQGYKLFFDPIFVVDLTRGLASTVSCFRYGP
jgi:hypothetical protein